jgi:hypothetical protein
MASVHNVEETLKDIVTVNEETNGGENNEENNGQDEENSLKEDSVSHESKKIQGLGHIKKNSWLASPPAHKKSPAQNFFYFLFKKTPTFIDQGALIYVEFLLTVVNCVNKLRNCVRK